uniref:Uncharacterized protein n=1 Tax=Leersia perrieri TaxID=77586 RepID=A0A0D9VH13_9ORYZ
MEIAAATTASRAVIDTSRPFQSVREAVEVFGERCVRSRASSDSGGASAGGVVLPSLKKLEAELAEARGELERLRQSQSQMEMAVSSITVQLDAGLAILSGVDKGKELAVVDAGDGDSGRVRSDRWEWDEGRAEEWMARLEYLPSLSEALAIKMVEDDDQLGEKRQRKAKRKKQKSNAMNKKKKQQQQKKKKNGISFIGRLFSRKDKSR